MNRTLFTNVGIWDATGAATYPGEVLIEGNRIAKVSKGGSRLPRDGAEVMDAAGATLIPGLCEGHAHPSFSNAASTVEIGDIPPEEHVLVTMRARCSTPASPRSTARRRPRSVWTSSSATRSTPGAFPGRGCARQALRSQ
jgi:predicted amidohydrolase YtcJ